MKTLFFAVVFLIISTFPITALGRDYDYHKIDKHALKASRKDEQSVETLAAYLTKKAENDREICRAIFRWMTEHISYDTDAFFSGEYGDCSASGVLKARKSVCSGYATLFKKLGSLAGLEVVKISGYAKGYSYKEGRKFKTTNHAWNAVKLNGEWRLLDVTWGAGHLEGKKYVKSFKESYFLTPPEHLIFNHFPKDSNWQLLKSPITLGKFEDQPYLRPRFFALGFSVSDVQSYLDSDDFRGFPKLYGIKNKNVTIHKAPIKRYLQTGTEYTFVVESKVASDAAIINNGEWHYLKEDDHVFSGTVLGQCGELKLSFKLRGEGRSYWTLLKYEVE